MPLRIPAIGVADNPRGRARRVALVGVALLLPVLGLLLLLARPSLDGVWEHDPSHFWLVLGAGAVNAGLAYATGIAARRRRDARVFLMSLAFLVSAGFLGLHALATPGVLLEGANSGFVLATPVGLVLAAVFAAAASAVEQPERAEAVVRHAGLLQGLVVAALAVWAVWSLAGWPPLDHPDPPERLSGPLVAAAIPAVLLYGVAVVRFVDLYIRRGSDLVLAMACALALLAEATVAVAASRNWHATWWEWHLMMLGAFVLIAIGAQREWHEERFGDLYLQPGEVVREMSVLFADLSGFTAFSERHDARETTRMLNTYLEVVVPRVVEEYGGTIDRLIGDAVMAIFNRDGTQPDHAHRAACAALDLQRATAAVADQHPDWPRFRVGVNTGEAAVVVLGAAGGRTFSVIGDTVNLAARLQALAPVGGVAIGPGTFQELPDAVTAPLGPVHVKGRTMPVEAFVLTDLPHSPAARRETA